MVKRLKETIDALQAKRQLIVIDDAVDPYLEMAAIHRRVYAVGGPAILYSNVKNSRFAATSNLFGTVERAKYLLRDGYDILLSLQKWHDRGVLPLQKNKLAIREKWKMFSRFTKWKPQRYRGWARKTAWSQFENCNISDLPQIQCWPQDGGSFILLPQVYSEDQSVTAKKRLYTSNLGMYRIQLQGQAYRKNQEIGLHYQTHRGIGIHHQRALAQQKKLKVSIFVGGPPVHCFAAVFPTPEFLPELFLAGMLNNRRFRYLYEDDFLISADADFCLLGEIGEGTRLEGPFGDHLGYYSLAHPFPYLQVKQVYCRADAIWPFTVVGRPPQEDSIFGHLIHEMTAPLVNRVLPGVREVHAVDESGVHPLLLALGRETYTPYANNQRPAELLTLAHRILGFGQLALAKFLLIMNESVMKESLQNLSLFFTTFLSRTKLERDLHFLCNTTIDTLDYSGDALNQGSKLIWTAGTEIVRNLLTQADFEQQAKRSQLISHYRFHWLMPGICTLQLKQFQNYQRAQIELLELTERIEDSVKNANHQDFWSQVPLLVVADCSQTAAASLRDFLWVAFTRSNPAKDIYGCFSQMKQKHWSCRGPLIIDARLKPHHSPVLENDPEVEKRVDQMGAKGGVLHGII